MRVLLVKLSSLGDVVHNLPVVSDLAHAHPGIEIDWAIETPYADIASMHPAVKRVLPVPLRQLKKQLFSIAAWRDFLASRARLGAQTYDQILDTQGLLKSAWVSHWANGPVTGQSATSAREPLAARFYERAIDVPREHHAVTRNRMLAAQAFGYALSGPVRYGIAAPHGSPEWAPASPYAVFLHATSRASKMWPDRAWIELGARLGAHGLDVVLPWGSEVERQTSERLSRSLGRSVVPPRISLTDAAAMLARARVVVGVDTGLAHLSVALERPTIGIYITTRPALTGLLGRDDLATNLGGGSEDAPKAPDVETVWQALHPLLAQA